MRASVTHSCRLCLHTPGCCNCYSARHLCFPSVAAISGVVFRAWSFFDVFIFIDPPSAPMKLLGSVEDFQLHLRCFASVAVAKSNEKIFIVFWTKCVLSGKYKEDLCVISCGNSHRCELRRSTRLKRQSAKMMLLMPRLSFRFGFRVAIAF